MANLSIMTTDGTIKTIELENINDFKAQEGETLMFDGRVEDYGFEISGSDIILTLPNGEELILTNMADMLSEQDEENPTKLTIASGDEGDVLVLDSYGTLTEIMEAAAAGEEGETAGTTSLVQESISEETPNNISTTTQETVVENTQVERREFTTIEDTTLFSDREDIGGNDFLDTTAPTAPTINLNSASDTGSSDSDNITSDNNPIFTGTAESGSTITIVADANEYTTLTDSSGSWSLQLDGLSDGTHDLLVTATDSAGNVSDATSQAITVDTTISNPTADISDASDSGSSNSDNITNDNTPTITGTGEAGSTVVITNAAGEEVGSATVGEDGTYSITTSELEDGSQNLTITTTDTAGNTSSTSQAITVDTTISNPTADISDASDSGSSNSDNITNDNTPTITGTGEAGSTVVITNAAGEEVGSATVGEDGTYSITTSELEDGSQNLTITTTDTAGNTSSTSQAITVDTTISNPTADISDASDSGSSNSDNITNDNTPTITGTGEVGSTVVITNAAGEEVGSATVGEDGTYSITTSELEDGSQNLTITTTDTAGNTSSTSQAITVDTTISNPTADISDASDSGSSNSDNITNDNTPTITGTGEAGSTVVITNEAGEEVGSAIVGEDGTYSITTSELEDGSQNLTITTTDTAGNTSSTSQAITVDTTISNPTADISDASDSGSSNSDNITNDNTPTITGTGEVGSTVVITNEAGEEVGSAIVGEDGTYSITTSELEDGSQNLTITTTDTAGNTSSTSQAITVDTTISNPTADISDASDSGSSNSDNITNDNTPTITGTGEAGSTVVITNAAGEEVGSAIVGEDGTYSITTSELEDGSQNLTITTTDTAGNTSSTSQAITVDTTISNPTADISDASDSGSSNSDNITNDNTPTITGTGEAGSTVVITNEAGEEVGSAIVGEDGTYSITTSELEDGSQNLTITTTDTAGNTSSTSQAITVDTTISNPTADISDASDSGSSNSDNITNDNTPTITGTGEVGSTVVITNEAGEEVGSAIVGEDGTYSITTSELEDGSQNLTITTTDTAGNTSSTSQAITVDTTISNPTADISDASDSGSSNSDNITNDNTPTITGTGEAGSTVVITNAAGEEVGSAIVGEDGTYSITTSELEDGSQNLTITTTDTAGNTSSTSQAITVDTTISNPTADISDASDSGSSNSDNITNDNTPTITGTGEAGSTVVITNEAGEEVGSAIVGEDGTYSITTSELEDGSQNLTITTTDTAGNTSSTSQAITVDTQEPVVTVDALTTSDNTPEITGTIDDPNATVNVAIGDKNYEAVNNGDGTWTLADNTITNLDEVGIHDIVVTATDLAGNTSTDTSVDELNIFKTTDLGGDENGTSVSFRLSGDHYDPNNIEDVGAGSPQYQIMINGEPYVSPDGTSTFSVEANRGEVNESDTGIDRSVPEFEIVTLNVPEGVDINSVSIKFVNDAYDSATNDNDNDGILNEDRNLVVDNLNIGGTLNTDGSYSGGVTLEAEDKDTTQYLASNGNDVSGRETMAWNGEMTFYPDGVSIEAPSIQLVSSSDTGSLDNDNITSDNTPSIKIEFGSGTATGDVISIVVNGEVVDTYTITSNDWKAGSVELDIAELSDGNHDISVSVSNNNMSSESSLSQSITIDTQISDPTADLDSASDSGVSNTDNITNDNTPTITGTGEVGATVEITDTAGNVIGTGVVDENGNYSITTSELEDGSQDLTITTTDIAGNSSSTTQSITVDTTIQADNDSAKVEESGVVKIDVLSNDEAGLTITSVETPTNSDGEALGTVEIITVDGVQQIEFTPGDNYKELMSGESEDVSFTYQIQDTLGNITEATVTVTVEGKSNDISQVVDSDDSANVITENVESGTYTGVTLSATDADGEEITYSLPDDVPFTIDEDGRVVTDGEIDYESVKSYSFEVTATSADGSSSKETITIQVNDVSGNDVGTDGKNITGTITGSGTITGTDEEEKIYGYEDADTIDAGAGNDNIYSRAGNDTIDAGSGNDSISAGAGDDIITGGTGRNSINAGSGDDTITITEGDGKANYEVVHGGAGEDTVIFEGNREDYIITHESTNERNVITNIETGEKQYIYDDVENIQFADTTISTNDLAYDNDNVTGTDGDDRVYSGTGDDTINTGAGNDYINAGAGNDIINAGEGRNTIDAKGGDDTIHITEGDGTSNYDIVRGGEGNDTAVFEDDRDNYTISHDADNERSIITNIQTGEVNYIYDDVENIQFADETILSNDLQYDNDNVVGTDDADKISSGTGDDIINSGAGNDNISSHTGNDTIDAGAGNDNIYSGAGDDIITGGTGRNNINAGSGDDTITITEGDGTSNYDVVRGGSGDDTVIFEGNRGDYTITHEDGNQRSIITNIETGEKQYIYDDVENIQFADETILTSDIAYDNDNIIGTDENDNISSGTGDDVINSGAGNDIINTGSGNDTVEAGSGNDNISTGIGDDIISAGEGRNNISAGGGDDTITITEGDGTSNYDVVHGGEGDDTVIFSGNRDEYVITHEDSNERNVITNIETGEKQYIYDDVENIQFADETISTSDLAYDNDNVTGTDEADRIHTGTGDDTINSGAGDDNINSGSGSDTINTGLGNDNITAGTGDDIIFAGEGRNYINAGDGDDTITITEGDGTSNYDVVRGGEGNDTVILSGNKDDYTITHEDNNERSIITNTQTGERQYIYDDVENIQFADETISLSNNVVGIDDIINTGSENDTINSGTGNDTIDAGAGNDNIKAGAGDDIITGGTGRNSINAGGGDDTINITEGDGTSNYEVVYGGEGNDTVIFEGDRDDYTITHEEDIGRSVVRNLETNEVQYIYDDVENIQFADETISTSDLAYDNDNVTGTNGADQIHTGTGEDIINSGGGNDSISSGSGADTINSGSGNDSIRSGAGDDIINAGEGRNSINAGGGDDTITITEGDGTSNYDVVRGGEGNDTVILEGNREDYTITHEENNERSVIRNIETNEVQYIYDDVENIQFADETISTSDFAYDNDSVTGTNGAERVYSGTGDDTINTAGGNDSIDSGSGNDTIDAGSGNDNINAGAGDDIITGGTGRNNINAGSGDDTITITEGDGTSNYDVVHGGEGNDTVIFSGDRADYTITHDDNNQRSIIKDIETGETNYIYDDVENIQFADETISTSDLTYDDDTITGTDGTDRVNTGTGDDSISTGAGNDSIYSGRGNDTIDAGAGNDSINAGSGDDIITGGTGRNSINAGGGDDTITITEGDGTSNYDVVYGGEGDDTVVFEGNREDYTITHESNNERSVIRNLETNEVQYIYDDVENIQFSDETISTSDLNYDNDVITGTDDTDRIYSGTGDDTINTGAGNDSITAGAGDDTITGGTGRNSIYAGGGDDTINITEGDGSSNYEVVRGGDGNDTVVFSGERADYTIIDQDNNERSIIKNIETGEAQYIYDDVENIQFSDGVLDMTTGTFTLDNDAPEAGDDTTSIQEDTSVTIDASTLLANDTDNNGDILTIQSVQNATKGTVSLDSDGNVVFTPEANYNGEASFTYTISDGNGETDTATVTINVTPDGYTLAPTSDLDATSDTGASDSDNITNDNTPTINGTTEPGATVVITTAAGIAIGTAVADENGEYSITTTELPDGEQTLTITATDTAGNTSSTTETLTIDTQVDAPVISDVVDTNGNMSEIMVSGTADEAGNTITLYDQNNNVVGTTTVDENGNWSIDIADLSNDSEFTISATQTDALGNESVSSNNINTFQSDYSGTTTYSSDDYLFTGSGNDSINISADDSNNNLVVDGGDGYDTVKFSDHSDSVSVNLGDNESETIGDDTVELRNIEDIYGGQGNDSLIGDSGSNLIYGDGGADTIDGGLGDDLLYGGSGNDIIKGGEGNDTLAGGSGDDYLDGGAGNDTVVGQSGNDTLIGGSGDDRIFGQFGDDTIIAGAGNDNINGGADTDTIIYSGNFEDYTITIDALGGGSIASSVTITDNRDGSPDGVDKIVSVENIKFADGIYDATTMTFSSNDTSTNVDAPILDMSIGDVEESSSVNVVDPMDSINLNGFTSYNEGDLSQNQSINGGNGKDHIIIGDTADGVNINTGNGSDVVQITGDIGGNTSFDGGNGSDTLVLGKSEDSYTINNYTNNNGTISAQVTDNDTGNTLSVNNIEDIQYTESENITTYSYDITLNSALSDTSGEETLSDITLKDLPDSAILKDSDGNEIGANDDGTYTVSTDENGDASVTIQSDIEITQDELDDITASVTSTETDSGDKLTLETSGEDYETLFIEDDMTFDFDNLAQDSYDSLNAVDMTGGVNGSTLEGLDVNDFITHEVDDMDTQIMKILGDSEDEVKLNTEGDNADWTKSDEIFTDESGNDFDVYQGGDDSVKLYIDTDITITDI